jgi:hypothetical protein
MPVGNEGIAKRLVVIDLAVEDDPSAAVFIRDGLMPGAQIDDAEPAHAEAATAIDINAFVVGATMANLITHGLDCGRFSATVSQHKAGYPAHEGA